MKKKSASKSAFFNLRVLIGLCVALAGIALALVALDAYAANSAPVKIRNHIITASNDPLVPVGFDCSKIEELGIHKMENFRAGAIMLACGADATPGSSSVGGFFQRIGRAVKKLLVPLYGAGDVNLITGTETPPNIVQSETFTTVNPDNPQQICVAYNDSRGRNVSPINISGASCSTDGGATFTRLTTGSGQSPFVNTTGDPVILYNKPTATWFTVWIGDGACGGGLGGFKSTTPWDPNSWTHYPCVHSGASDDRESGYADNRTSGVGAGNMYVSWNDFAVGGGAIRVVRSTDNGTTWSAPVNVTASFIRNVQITADKVTGVVYIAGMDENSGSGCTSGCGTNRNNKLYRSTDAGVTWTNTYTGPAFVGPCRSNSGFFCTMYSSPAYWRHMGWGEPAAFNGVVSLVYAQKDGADPGNVYYIRSTDMGVTFSAPVQLNANTDPTKAQWQPNLSVSEAGTLFATWYDEAPRTSASCQPSSPSNLCYQMHSRKSPDNGVTWLADETLSDVASPLPLQQDPGIQPTYVGDYDYGSAVLTKHATSWVDGRNPINGNSQQDAFTDRDLVGFAVTTSTPACNSLINTQPVDFIINLTDPVNTATVQASDFTVNGIPSNLAPTFSNGNATITFHYSTSPVTVQGPQTMNIAAGAFNRASDNAPNFAFNCTFCYALTPLQVVSTVPPVGGTFSPPAPNNYNYDVNFNQAVDPASVTISDLTWTGNAGGSTTAVSLINGNTTARFTVHFNFGGSATATIGAGAITANTCNGNAAFSGNYSVLGCPPSDHYTISQIGGAIVPGTTDIGNHGDDTVTTIALPFPYTLYDTTFTSVNLSSNGNAQFTTTDTTFTNVCLPWTAHNYTIFPYWDDLYLVNSGFGIFTSISGTAPNRIFNIEWRAQYFPGSGTANLELRLYEGQTRFDVIYGTVTGGNTSATAGVQKNNTAFDQYFCNGAGQPATGGQSYILQPCTTPTPTATGSPSATPTASATATATPTAPATATPTAPATATPTASPTCTPNYTFTVGTGTIVPGTTDTGNHIDDGTTPITLPFPYTLYGQSFTAANLSSNGNIQFVSNSNSLANACPLPSATMNMAIYPEWDDLRTDQIGTGCTAYGGVGCGIFTSISGTAPNRIFNIEWRTVYFGANTTRANFELRLYEGQNRFDMVYGETAQTGSSSTEGVQRGTGVQFTQYACNTAGSVNSGLQLVFTEPPCGTPTPTATPTTTASPVCSPAGWSAGAPLPSVGVRLVGVYFPANGRFYAMGGRSADTAGSDFTHPFEYNPATNTWTTKAATYADNQVNNMACGVLTDAGTPYIYCVGGSAAGATTATSRVFRYNPVTDVISPVAAPWPGANGTTTLPGGFTIFQNKLYILGGFTISPAAAVNTIWEFTPTTNVWVQKPTVLPVARAYIPTTTIGTLIYTGGGTDVQAGLLVDAAESFVYNPVGNAISPIANIPRPTGETRALNINNRMWVMGGGRTAPNPSNEVDIYDPVAGTWSIGTPFATARRNFPTDTDGTCRVWLAGGYAPTTPTDAMEIFCCGGGQSPTPTGTPSATPTCPPGGSPGPWTQAAPVTIDHYGGFMDSNGTVAWEGGGYSFSAAGNINQFGRFDPVANTWTPLAPVPDLNNAMASGVYAPNVNKLFVFGGENVATATVVNTTRIYDVATGVWSTGAPMPDVRAFMGSGYFNGKIYLVGGYTTGSVDPSFGQVWEYDPVLNTWNTTRMSMPVTPALALLTGTST
jgi:Kelch motif/Galactose oxidase, central domain